MLFAVRTRVVRLGTDRLMDEEMDATRLLARRSVRRRLRRGRFPSAVMELSVKSMASCWSWVGVQVRSDDGERDGCDQTIHAFVTPKFSIVGILYPLRSISETCDMEVADSPRRSSWRSLIGFIAEGACASSSGVSLTMAEVLQSRFRLRRKRGIEPSTATTRSTTSSNETCIPETQFVCTPLRLRCAPCPHTCPDLSLARMPTPLLPWSRSAHSPSPYTGPVAT
jgi:hypothetical protein